MPYHACARRRWRRWRRAGLGLGLGRGLGTGTGSGSGSESGSGSGSLPGLVLFESGLTGMGCAHTRSATRTRPAPLFGSKLLQLDSQQSHLLGRTVATVQTELLQPFVGFRPVGPSWSAINSAPVSHSKHTNTKRNLSLYSSSFRTGRSSSFRTGRSSSSFRTGRSSSSFRTRSEVLHSELGSEVLK